MFSSCRSCCDVLEAVDEPVQNFPKRSTRVMREFNKPRLSLEDKIIYPPKSAASIYSARRGNRPVFYRIGERGSGIRLKNWGFTQGPDQVPFQDFYAIRKKCLEEGTLFEDPEFPAHRSSLFLAESSKLDAGFEEEVVWRRPHEISAIQDKTAYFTLKGSSQYDAVQGQIGNCWLVAAVASLAQNPSIFSRVVPSDNTLDPLDDYCGAVHFRLWQYGRWIDVVVDDRLPTNEEGQTLFMTSASGQEFWSGLLEKAYAKLNGSYEALEGGWNSEALEDFTGGVAEMFTNIKEEEPSEEDEKKSTDENEEAIKPVEEVPEKSPEEMEKVFQAMLKAFGKTPFMGCSLVPVEKIEEKGPKGLIRGHAYTITDVRRVQTESGEQISLVRVRNPWGNSAEWAGDWSDEDKNWSKLSEEVKKDLGLTFEADGEFWMDFKDFFEHFGNHGIVEIVYIDQEYMDVLEDGTDGKADDSDGPKKLERWSMVCCEGAWIRGLNAGGPESETFGSNPQFHLRVDYEEKEQKKAEDEGSTVFIALMQKNCRARQRNFRKSPFLPTSFKIFDISELDKWVENVPVLKNDYFEQSTEVASADLCYFRENVLRLKLKKGSYCIVPFTLVEDVEGEFILRVFSKAKLQFRELGGEKSIEMLKTPFSSTDSDAEVIEALKMHFQTVVGPESQEMDWTQLKEVLNLALRAEFEESNLLSGPTCRLLIAAVDVDRSGELDLSEFFQLWEYLKQLAFAFKSSDTDNSGYLKAGEVGKALESAGCKVTNDVLKSFILRYGDRNRQICLDAFVSFMITLRTALAIFKEKELKQREKSAEKNSGEIKFTFEDWLETMLF